MKEEIQDNAGVIYWPPAIYAIPLAVGIIAHLIYSVSFLPEGWLWRLLGVLLIGFGIFLALWAERTMHSSGTTPNPYKPTTAIVTAGPYRFTRNPMYLSMALCYLGVTFLMNALWPLLLLSITLFIVNYGVIAREERYLAKKFGDAYVHYKSRVRRWI
ncbi:isoprenylcysteine carboxylmethyltransferase family protein [Candidatus Acetothermia bacterium]|nr:isoprenylcysteine carboxylmethyltransferase family protein [Candidatus Acetothermia bacterium]MBI3459686.1 isoprenylcysteine carboxylmethyltransferase family protein [Candidatus Acetothermia bacterium]